MITIACVRCHGQLTVTPGFPSVGCPHCGTVNAVPMMGQPMMGQPVMVFAPAGMMRPKCSRATYVLLGFFLGLLGVHNFVAGHSGRGIAQLLITIFLGWMIVPILAVWLWVIIEICTMTEDASGARMA